MAAVLVTGHGSGFDLLTALDRARRCRTNLATTRNQPGPSRPKTGR